MIKLLISILIFFNCSIFTFSQAADSIIIHKLQLMSELYSEIDTFRAPYSVTITDKFNEEMYCGVLKNGKRIGKWITLDANKLPNYIKYYSINGKDSISINLVRGGTSIKSIIVHNPKIWTNFFRDTLETMAWETSDTTRMKYYFYSSGQVETFGELFFPHLPFLRKPILLQEGKGKNKKWNYYNLNGTIIKEEWWKNGLLIKSKKY